MSIRRLFDIPHHALVKFPNDTMFATKYNGKWEKTSTQEYINSGIRITLITTSLHLKFLTYFNL